MCTNSPKTIFLYNPISVGRQNRDLFLACVLFCKRLAVYWIGVYFLAKFVYLSSSVVLYINAHPPSKLLHSIQIFAFRWRTKVSYYFSFVCSFSFSTFWFYLCHIHRLPARNHYRTITTHNADKSITFSRLSGKPASHIHPSPPDL